MCHRNLLAMGTFFKWLFEFQLGKGNLISVSLISGIISHIDDAAIRKPGFFDDVLHPCVFGVSVDAQLLKSELVTERH